MKKLIGHLNIFDMHAISFCLWMVGFAVGDFIVEKADFINHDTLSSLSLKCGLGLWLANLSEHYVFKKIRKD